ncbi:LexA family protein [Ktedonospora formicarum]|uniref:UmuD protein n=1 Tax=Ktedonospora formicarum TaxID=2778364 RepID=A0A8J3HYG1_9CHLR|nr:translesion error-prone DNA polymerase V autoproteolytic subunit [Ktedonospora formicarum]GHO46049.1 umuD protein [Ktedonospora formicarum]
MLCLYIGEVGGGFPSPAEGWRERALDIHDLLQEHREATFYMVVRGDSMQGAGIIDGDLVVVDRALKAHHESIIIALVNDGFLVKRYTQQKDGTVILCSAHPRFPPLPITPQMTFEVWGVVTYVVRSLRPGVSLRARLRGWIRRGEL